MVKWSSRWSLTGWLAAAVAITPLACGGDTEETGSEAATQSDRARPETTKAGRMQWGTELPENFPDDVPRFPGARITKVQIAPDEGLAVTFATDEEINEVIDYFADSFAAEGWSTEVRDMAPGRAVFADKAQRFANVVTLRENDETPIVLILYEMN